MTQSAPVLTIDGPTGSGKGTISHIIAERLGWHFLDSGVFYRILGLSALNHHVKLSDSSGLTDLAESLPVKFIPGKDELQIVLEGVDITSAIRTPDCSEAASKVAVIPEVRLALNKRMQAFQQSPGLVADGRDMGTIVFPNAEIKIYLDATLEERAKRRHAQLQKKGINASLQTVLEDVRMRDVRDMARVAAPLKPAEDAVVIDSTHLSIDQVLQTILTLVRERTRVAVSL